MTRNELIEGIIKLYVAENPGSDIGEIHLQFSELTNRQLRSVASCLGVDTISI